MSLYKHTWRSHSTIFISERTPDFGKEAIWFPKVCLTRSFVQFYFGMYSWRSHLLKLVLKSTCDAVIWSFRSRKAFPPRSRVNSGAGKSLWRGHPCNLASNGTPGTVILAIWLQIALLTSLICLFHLPSHLSLLISHFSSQLIFICIIPVLIAKKEFFIKDVKVVAF